MAAREPEERAYDAAATPAATTGAEPSVINGTPDTEYDEYLTSGANPFSSVYPPGTGSFPRLLPREFPRGDDPESALPVMEQLPDPNALPGYPVLAGDQQAFPAAAAAFPPAEESSRSAPAAFPAISYQSSDDPYAATRSPQEAPPLHGPASSQWSDIRAGTSPLQAPPLSAAPVAPGAGAAPAPFPASPPSPGYPDSGPSAGYPASPPSPGYPPDSEPPFGEAAAAEPPARETADNLTAELLLHGKRPPPGAGWRRTVYRASGGLIRVGESAASLRRRDLVNRVRTPVAGGHHRVAVMSLKGGVGKTTAAVGLGATLASLRGDRVIAVDANPDRGTLSDKVRLETSATIRDLLNERALVTRYADVRAFTSQSSSRLEILASDRDPGVSVAFSADDYRAVARVLEHYYSICITDCGTGLLHSAMSGILELADHIVLVSSPSVDGARSASATLDWLEAHDYGDLVRNAVVVLSTIRLKSKSTVDLDRLEQHFAARSRAVVRIPYDPHLEEGAEVELELLNSETADAFLTLAAHVGDGFAVPRRPVSHATPRIRFA